MHCCDPQLTDIPDEDWFCANCLSEGPETAKGKDITEDASVLEFLRTGACNETGAALAGVRKRAQHYVYEGTTPYKRPSGKFGKRKIPAKAERIGIIKACHNRCGHFGVERTESLILPHCTWTGMRKDISEYIQDCHPCKEHASKFNMDPTLHTIPVTPTCWHTIGIDIIGPPQRQSRGIVT